VNERPTDPGSRAGAWWPVVLLVLGPLLYVASVGPVAWFVRTGGVPMDSLPGQMISIVYWPVEFLANEVALFEDVLMWYVELFVP
jgi:hypothetical protein